MPLFHCHCFVIVIFCIASSSLAASDDFIKTSCGATSYPDLCYETLSAYADSIEDEPLQLANAALNVTLESAESTSNNVTAMSKEQNLRPKEANAIRDCVENLEDSVDELQQSLMTMKELEGPDFDTKMSNIQTWVSAALTDEDTCMDGLEGNAMNGNVKAIIRGYIEKVAHLTSNALALINLLKLN